MSGKKLERLLGVAETRKILGSYGKSEFYRKLETGEIRALYEMRGNRRHWSIPESALSEFIDRLHSNQTDIGGGLDAIHPALQSNREKAAPKISLVQQDRSQRAVSGAASVRPSARSKPVLGTHGLGAAPREQEDA